MRYNFKYSKPGLGNYNTKKVHFNALYALKIGKYLCKIQFFLIKYCKNCLGTLNIWSILKRKYDESNNKLQYIASDNIFKNNLIIGNKWNCLCYC